MLYVIIYAPFPILRLGMIFSVFCRILDLFPLTLTLIECILTPYGCPQSPCLWKKEKNRRLSR